ncbi:MAG: glycoside hydrolase family 47 protein [Melioribacteraceae bacterium]|nr:glycoside hydrolase family 47 protein [Melioribacteraceae bacterium]
MNKKIISFMLLFTVVISSTNIFSQTEIDKQEYAEKVKSAFLDSWNAYKKYAWGHDALKPLSKTYHNWHEVSLLMTPVDAFDTMILMGLTSEAEEAKELIFNNLSFDHDLEVQNFEITIRLLGGLISAYMWDGDERFRSLVIDLADRLLPVFDSPTGMPYNFVNLKTGKTRGEINNPAEIGTLILEFGAVSKLTGDPKYYEKVRKGMLELANRSSSIGLVGTTINVETGEWINTDSHISGMIDSYYEYLLKAAILFDDVEMMNAFNKSIEGINKYLADEVDGRLWYSHVNMETGERLRTQFGALDAFFPAVLALSGDVDRAAALQESCIWMWNLHGIEPEQYDYAADKVLSEAYYLRPENIESAYYLYQITNDEKYLQMGAVYYESLIKYCKADEGFAHLESVITKKQSDNMESFFLAETLKYLYLIFAPEETLDFNSVIFNTEAHPFKKSMMK